MLTETAIVKEDVRIQGPGRVLEGVLAYPSARADCSVLIAGPHPFLGGDMHNNVVSTLLDALASQGAVALAFNYAGVGASEGGPEHWPTAMSAFWKRGSFPQERDWADDAGTAMKALQEWFSGSVVLIGYSFGCWAIMNHLRTSQTKAVVLISPNPSQHSFSSLSDCSARLLLIHSDVDFTCSLSETIAWVDSVREPKTRVQLSAGEHFFRGHESELSETVLGFLMRENIISGQ
jgi:uncharacterized protein